MTMELNGLDLFLSSEVNMELQINNTESVELKYQYRGHQETSFVFFSLVVFDVPIVMLWYKYGDSQ